MGNDIGINSYTLAVITTDKNMNTSGGCPIFYANDDDDLQKKALLMAKCVDGIGSKKIMEVRRFLYNKQDREQLI